MDRTREIKRRVAEALRASFMSRISESAGVPFSETGVSIPVDEIWDAYAEVAVTTVKLSGDFQNG